MALLYRCKYFLRYEDQVSTFETLNVFEILKLFELIHSVKLNLTMGSNYKKNIPNSDDTVDLAH